MNRFIRAISRPTRFVLYVMVGVFSFLCSAKPQQPVSVAFLHSTKPYVVIPVSINGHGPYPFVMDSGTVATVVDSSLFKECGLQEDAAFPVTTMMGTESKQLRSLAREVSVGKLSVRNIEVFRASGLSINITDPRVRGIIGENFLDHFDLLIDNEHRQLLLDEGGVLASSFDGEHLPMSQTSTLDGEVIHHRPVVYVTLPSYSSGSLRMLLDTGTNGLTLFPAAGRKRSVASTGTLTANVVGGGLFCETWSTKVLWGKWTLRDVQAASCRGASANKFDVEGNMPTYFFKRILISHADSYVVVNPERRSIGTSSAAAVRPQH